jgi:hypothetical protein
LAVDEVIGRDLEPGEHYQEAWFLVSQIVRDHGREGLAQLWHAVPPGADAERVRAKRVVRAPAWSSVDICRPSSMERTVAKPACAALLISTDIC